MRNNDQNTNYDSCNMMMCCDAVMRCMELAYL